MKSAPQKGHEACNSLHEGKAVSNTSAVVAGVGFERVRSAAVEGSGVLLTKKEGEC